MLIFNKVVVAQSCPDRTGYLKKYYYTQSIEYEDSYENVPRKISDQNISIFPRQHEIEM